MVDGGWTKKDPETGCYCGKDGKWPCVEGASAQKPPRSKLEAKWGAGSAAGAGGGELEGDIREGSDIQVVWRLRV